MINLSKTFNYCTQFPQNWQSSQITNISKSTAIQHVYYRSSSWQSVWPPVSLRLTYRNQQCIA